MESGYSHCALRELLNANRRLTECSLTLYFKHKNISQINY